jgi:hypothetical protein
MLFYKNENDIFNLIWMEDVMKDREHARALFHSNLQSFERPTHLSILTQNRYSSPLETNQFERVVPRLTLPMTNLDGQV